MDDKLPILRRMVCFKKLQTSPSQATRACDALRNIQGIVQAEPLNSHRIRLSFSLQYLRFSLIEELLEELGFHLDRSLFPGIRRMIYQYLEDNALENLNFEEDEKKLVCRVDTSLTRPEPEKYWTDYR